jgi:hypothetical protein
MWSNVSIAISPTKIECLVRSYRLGKVAAADAIKAYEGAEYNFTHT